MMFLLFFLYFLVFIEAAPVPLISLGMSFHHAAAIPPHPIAAAAHASLGAGIIKSISKPIKSMAARKELEAADRVATNFIDKQQWLLPPLKPPAKNFARDRLMDFFTLLCHGKYHPEESVRLIALAVQLHLIKEAPNPRMVNAVVNSLCFAKIKMP